MSVSKMTTASVIQAKGKRKMTMLTAYDYPTAKIFDQAKIDMLLVGDSMGHVVYGYHSTIPVTLEQTIDHCKAVANGAKTYSLLVGDMPFLTYGVSIEQTIENAGRILKEGNMEAVKLEGGAARSEEIEACIDIGIPVMGHLGLTPQSVNKFGGYKVQGRTAEMAEFLLSEALALEKAGCFSIVLEAIPWQVAKVLTEKLKIPTIGIGAGIHCDAQVLVWPDALGLFDDFTPKFVKKYANLNEIIKNAVIEFKNEVESKIFPDTVIHSYNLPEDELKKFMDNIEKKESKKLKDYVK
jgi:3-methyl-2-oxobutanoate hydroxymethyltransferase